MVNLKLLIKWLLKTGDNTSLVEYTALMFMSGYFVLRKRIYLK